jgi:hypothetical protein
MYNLCAQVTIVAFFSPGSIVQIYLSLLICGAAIAVQVRVRPYRVDYLNLLQAGSLSIIYMTLQTALLLQYPDTVSTSSVNVFTALLVTINILMIVLPVLICIFYLLNYLPDFMHTWIVEYMEQEAAEEVLRQESMEPTVRRLTTVRSMSVDNSDHELPRESVAAPAPAAGETPNENGGASSLENAPSTPVALLAPALIEMTSIEMMEYHDFEDKDQPAET